MDSLAVGCVLPACQPYLFWWPPQDVSTGGLGSQMNKFNHAPSVLLPDVSSRRGDRSSGLMSRGQGTLPIPCDVPTPLPPPRPPRGQADACEKHYLLATSFAGGTNGAIGPQWSFCEIGGRGGPYVPPPNP